MVDIRKSTHRHHTRCIHSNTLVLLSLRLYRYRFVLFNKIRVHRTLLFVSLLGQNMSPLGVPARQPAIQSQSLESAPVTRKISPPAIQSQSLKSARVIQKTAHTRTRAHARLHTSVAIIPARELRARTRCTRVNR